MKYLNNGIESDHAPIKKLVVGTGGFKIRKRVWSTIQGFESLRTLNKGQLDFWLRIEESKTLVRERTAFMNRLFNVGVVYQ
jgi:transposase-like protein